MTTATYLVFWHNCRQSCANLPPRIPQQCRVIDDLMKPMKIRNMGKYDATFKYMVKSDLVRDLVTIAPDEGTLQPGKELTVEVSVGSLDVEGGNMLAAL
jgi:hypothetical protein